MPHPQPSKHANSPRSHTRLIGDQCERCLYCHGLRITREGKRYKKLETIQLWRCHDCNRVFTTQIAKGRRKIAQVLDDLQIGDTLIVSELSRLGRSMLECMEILSIAAHKGLHLHAVKGAWQLDGSVQSTIIAMAFAMAAEIERDLISQRTREALRAKKAAGVQLGRPRGPGKSKLDPYQPEIEALLANGSTQRFIAKRYGTSEANLCNWMRKRRLKRG